MNDFKTVKELAVELNVSKQTIHRTIQKRNIETIQNGNRILLDDIAQKTIKEDLQDKIENANRSETYDTNKSKNDFRTEYIESLKAQIEDLKADKQFLQDRLTAAEHERDTLTKERDTLTKERDQLTKERQTILAELLSLRQQPRIEAAAAAPKPSPSELRPQKPAPQQPRKRTLSERIKDFFK